MKNKKGILIIIIIVIVLILGAGGLCLFVFNKPKDSKVISENVVVSDGVLEVIDGIVVDENGSASYVGGSYTNVIVKDEESAIKALNSIKEAFLIKDANDEFKLSDSYTIGDLNYYKMQQYYNDILVYSGMIVITTDKDGKVLDFKSDYIPNVNVSTYSGMGEEKLTLRLKELYGESIQIEQITKQVWDDAKTLVYTAIVYNDDFAYEVILNAKNGELIGQNDLVVVAEYSYKDDDGAEKKISLEKNGDDYEYFDKERNIKIFDGTGKGQYGALFDISNEYKTKDIENSLIYNKAMKLFEDIYDFYYDNYNWKSYDNKGSSIKVSVNVDWNNAAYASFFNKYIIGYNDDSKISYIYAKDVLGHEFTHGVVAHTSKFSNYCGEDKIHENQPGALNEAYADIFGSIIENDNWEIGDKTGSVLRNIEDPLKTDNPKEYGGENYIPNYVMKQNNITSYEDYYKELLERNPDLKDDYHNFCSMASTDNGWVHKNSTVVSHSAYLMYEKGAFKDKVELGRVWFGALQKLSKHSNFEDAALAVLSSAKDLGYSVDKLNLIREAFEETKILNDYYVKGQVTDNDGKGLSNVSVTIINNDNPYLNYELLTDKSGNFEFRNIPLGDYSIAYEKAKYTKVENQLKISDDIDDIKVSLNKIKEKNYDAIDVVFVVDISASMTENDPSDFRKQILVNILSSMDLDSRASVVVFNKVGKVLNDGLSDSVVGKKVIMTDIYNIANDSGYQDNSGTNGKAGLQTALRLFDKDKKTRKYVIFFTDGKDTVSNKDDASYDELIKKAKKLDVRIITVGLGDDIESSMLIKLANETSGKYYIADFDTNLTGFDKKIFDEIQ